MFQLIHRFKKELIIALFLIAAAAIAFFLYLAHYEALLLAKEQFSRQQSILVRNTARGIERNMAFVLSEIDFLSREQSIKDIDIKEARKDMEEHFRHVRSIYVNDIALIDSNGIARIPLKAPHLTGADFSYREYFRQARLLERGSPVYELITFKGVDIGDKGIAIAMPVFPEEGKFGGLVLFTIKVKELIDGFIPPQTASGRTFVLDSKGNTLYHPDYPVGTNMEKLPGTDLSFRTFIEYIKTGSAYETEYISPEGIRTVASSCPLKIAGQAWSVVMATPESAVGKLLIDFNSRYLLGAFIVVSSITGSLVFIILMINRWNLKLEHEVVERRKAEDTALASLREKEILIKEVHHRVKNNMEVITSLLRMQSEHIKEDRYKALLHNCVARIRSMSLIHEKLYRSENLAEVSFNDYLEEMTQRMVTSFGPGDRKIALRTDLASVSLGVDTAIPCGLIMNELISNSLKHAFPAGREGEITVGMHLEDKERVVLTVSDNGVGIPENEDLQNTGSLGMIIVNSLVRQINGKIEIDRANGTSFKVTFRLPE